MDESLKCGWKYYNHAAIPLTAPHISVDLEALNNGSVWHMREGGGRPLLARWTSDFDCGYETEWWYCIKDTPFDINAVKAKRRYEIKKEVSFIVKILYPFRSFISKFTSRIVIKINAVLFMEQIRRSFVD